MKKHSGMRPHDVVV